MKALKDLSNAGKARLLHSLFPQHMPGLIGHIAAMGETITEDPELQRATWKPGSPFTVEKWLYWAGQVQRTASRHGKRMQTNKGLFAHLLFEGYLTVFTCYCITTYVKVRRHPDPKFTDAVNLLFNP